MGQSRRLKLHSILISLIGPEGHVYFQPPATESMKYPCIRYKSRPTGSDYANDHPYRVVDGYELMVIDPDPDSIIKDKVRQLPTCEYVTHYAKDDLNHWIYNIFY